MFKTYLSIPVQVLACRIDEDGVVTKEKEDSTYKYVCKGAGASKQLIVFKATKEPKVGDYIINQSEDDVYHCPESVFDAKYRPLGFVLR